MITPVKNAKWAKYARLNGRGMGFFAAWGLHFARGCGIFLLFDDDFIGKWAARSAFFL